MVFCDKMYKNVQNCPICSTAILYKEIEKKETADTIATEITALRFELIYNL